MKGDFSRIPFNPAKHYAGVLHQQGRVWLDSDWNEDVLDRLQLTTLQLRDVVGLCGIPSPGTAFALTPSTDPHNLDDFHIAGGRCYVDGILCNLEQNISYLSQPDFPDPPRIAIPTNGTISIALVYLEAWRRLITYLEDDSVREIALGGPDTATRLKTIVQIKFLPLAASITCAQAVAQLLASPEGGTLTTLQPPPAAAPPSLCQLPDPNNYTGRENRLYRVEIYDGGDVLGAPGGAFQAPLSAAVSAGALALNLPSALTAAQVDAAQRSGFVTIASSAGVSERVPLSSVAANGASLTLAQGLLNSYPLNATVTGGVARFLWSRNNASFGVNVTGVAADRVTLTLSSLGRDTATSLLQGDLVEITDDASDLGPARGHLTFLASIPDPDAFTVVLADALPARFAILGLGSPPTGGTGFSQRHLVLRRWDGIGDANAAYSDTATPQMNLGDGVHIQFGGSNLISGDYWQFASRSADGSVEALVDAPPKGIVRRRAPLAIVSWGPPPQTSPPSSPPAGVAMTILQDCRKVFPPLVDSPPVDKGVHITGVALVGPNNAVTSDLANDTNVQITSFAGIDIHCDGPVDPLSVTRPTCFVTIEYPLDFAGQGAITTYWPLPLAGAIQIQGGTISWRPLPQTQALLSQAILASLSEPRGILTRITLKGNYIWSQNDPTSFLDGDVFGLRLSGSNNEALTFPSGDKRKGGDFQMWFWLVAAPSFAQSIQPVSAQIYVGDKPSFTVTLSGPAPAGSNALQVTTSVAAVAAVPASVPVPLGSSAVSFAVTGSSVGQTTITVAFGGQTVAATLIVTPPPVLTGQLALAPTSILLGGNATATVSLSGPAPAAGATVAISSSSPNVATVPANVTIPANATSATFNVHGAALGASTIAASFGGVTLTAVITVFRPKTKEKEKEIEKIRDVVNKLTDTRVSTKLSDALAASRSLGPLNGSAQQPGGNVPGARAFITPEERPPVEDSVLDESVE